MPIKSKKDKSASINMTKTLLAYHAELEAQDHLGETALFKALRSRNTGLVLVLLNHGANVNHVNNKGHIPVIFAIINMFKYKEANDLAKLLIDHTNIKNIQRLFEIYLGLWGKLIDCTHDK